MQKVFSHARRGFTLIELLLVIGIIAILASIVIVAINPTKQLGDARDSQRRSDVNTILSAVYQYAIDHSGNYPYDLQRLITTNDRVTYEICLCGTTTTCVATGTTAPASCGTQTTTNARVNLRQLTGAYVLAIPADPRFASGASTEYTIATTGNGRIKVCAPKAEQTAEICVTR